MPGTRNLNRPSSYTKKTYLEKVALINGTLIEGDVLRYAQLFGMSKPMVKAVIGGEKIDDRAVNQMYNLARNRKARVIA